MHLSGTPTISSARAHLPVRYGWAELVYPYRPAREDTLCLPSSHTVYHVPEHHVSIHRELHFSWRFFSFVLIWLFCSEFCHSFGNNAGVRRSGSEIFFHLILNLKNVTIIDLKNLQYLQNAACCKSFPLFCD